jgi:sigma-B regulation protein RsbU (phosphoserine phosphatase)
MSNETVTTALGDIAMSTHGRAILGMNRFRAGIGAAMAANGGPAFLGIHGSTAGSNTMAADTSDQVLQLRNELRHAREELERYGELLLTIQRSILPQQLPSVPGLDLAVHFADADGVGGDFYDVRPVGPRCWAIVIADVSGHGPAAAAILALVHALGNAVQGQQVPPGAALALVNKPLATRYLANTGQFVTAFVGLYDAEAGVLTYASAGHPAPRLVRGNEVERLNHVSGLPLGIDETSVYGEESLRLLPGDRLVLFTDGITESTNAAHEFFGDERLDAVLRAPASTAAELLDHVVNSVRTFRAGRPAGDDETCLVAVVKPVQQSTQVRRK